MPTDKKSLPSTNNPGFSSSGHPNFAFTGQTDDSALHSHLAQVLRITPEPLQQIDDYSVHRLICEDLSAYLDYLDQGLQEIGRGTAQLTLPPKQLFQQPGESGDFRVMPCVRTAADGRVHKTVKLVGTNRIGEQVPDQITVGKANYLHPQENFISHQFDACLLSSIRTGACAALASKYLLNHDDQAGLSVALVGAGRVGYYGLLCLLNSGAVASVQICDPTPGRTQNLTALIGKQWPELSIETSTYPQLSACDLLILATDSPEPVYKPEDFATRLVVSLGADCVEQRELHRHQQWLDQNIYVDTADSVSFGDLHAWNLQQPLAASRLIDLPQLSITNTDSPNHGQPSALFVGTGSALMDNLTMSYLVARIGQN
ncbi:MAG: hypothetical protein JKY89_13545 [Immundisolibacteraceae bacterium]|nr:hypothetical protein [Immundisolibacteraceae bacterium]